MHKTAQQLIREAYEAANGLPPASAALVKELASRLDISMAATSQACDERSAAINTLTATRVNSECPEGVDVQDWVKQLAAENVGLKVAISAVKRTAEECEVNGDELKYVVEPSEFEALTDLLDETPTTDRIVAGIKADGVEMAIDHIAQTICPNHETVLKEFAAQLREVSANG